MLSGIVEFLGWFGAVTVLAGYILFSTGKLPNGPAYQLFNLVGGLAVAVNVAAHHAVPSTIVNGIWAVVAVVVLVRMARARRAAKRAGLETHHERSTEPAATTAVLPVIGPAVRHHEPDATEQPDAPPSLQAATAATADTTATAGQAATAATADTTDQPDTTAPAAPMTESVPVITAAIAIALVNAAQEQRRAERNEQHDREQHEQHAS
ncbi:CBU_0592 family membrane protein [Curtobacterium sp. RRHDQ66]|uniref:CBU_0592 family membrane protein n=1 Tax=Curtobacterium guangdongense TaxID=3413380 RepID=UPI003BF371ED